MNRRLLLRRSLTFNFRNHIGVVLGAAVAAAVLVGALAVGDSVRETLKRRALDRIGKVALLLDGRDRFFGVRAGGLAGTNFGAGLPASHALRLPAVATRQDGSARANQVVLYGVPPEFWSLATAPGPAHPGGEEVFLNAALARQLSAKPGDELVFRIHKPSALSQDAVITPRDGSSVALRLKVGRIVGAGEFGDVAFAASQGAPLNAFVAYERLASAAGLPGRANLSLLADGPAVPAIEERVKRQFAIGDAELEVRSAPMPAANDSAAPRYVELISRRIFIEAPVAKAAAEVTNTRSVVPILTYLANGIGSEPRFAPYSMVAAVGAPYTPADMADDEIILNEWLAEDLGVKTGDPVSLVYYRVDAGAKLVEYTNTFRYRASVPMNALYADRTLMPEFPGLSKAESTQDWDAGFELTRQIRDKDEAYWKKWRGTPKAFVTLAAGRKMWANRFGDTTAIRWFDNRQGTLDPLRDGIADRIRSAIDPAGLGLKFQPIRDAALRGAVSGQDFGGLFIGFSFFLIVSAALLTALMFRFGIERRAVEIGTLLALGWTPKQAARLYLREGVALAAWGAIPGVLGGVLYGRGVIYGLNTIWSDAVAGAELEFHATTTSVIGGFAGAVLVAAFAQWLTLRAAMRRPARELLNEGVSEDVPKEIKSRRWLPYAFLVIGAACAGGGLLVEPSMQPGIFFGAGFLILTGSLLWTRNRYRAAGRRSVVTSTFAGLARRAPARQPGRSTAVIALLSIAVFLIVAVAANRLDASRDARSRASGTGGFALWASSSLPLVEDLNSERGREKLGLDPKLLSGMSVVPARVRDGDEASCLNLNYAQAPRLLGVDPARLAERGAFTFKSVADGVDARSPWTSLNGSSKESVAADGVEEIPAIGDANSIQWALKKKLGDTLDYVDERGRPFRVRLVGAVANSILQGQLIISEQHFTRLFPGETGYRVFLVDVEGDARPVAAELSRGLADFGLETVSAADRLNRFNAVQNTYLNTFQLLGGLGLLLGSVGLGLVVLRNVFERRGELGVMSAVGYSPARVQSLILREHLQLLWIGTGVGLLTALIAVSPVLATPGGELPWLSLAIIFGIVLANGVAWTWGATRTACRGGLLAALRGE